MQYDLTMTKNILIVVLIGLVALLIGMNFLGAKPEGEPKSEPIVDTTKEPDNSVDQYDGPVSVSYVNTDESLIVVTSPKAGDTVPKTITLSGEARGYWFFEATAPVDVVDWDGRIIGQGYVTADGEWMTENFVPFSGTLTYTLATDAYSARGAVIFRKSNASGLPEHDAAVEIPVILTR
jgi:hypothetical protein